MSSPLSSLAPGRPAIHGHRGAAGLAPENTMAAFEQAAQLGADWVELDVRTCATGELVVVHDADLRRLAGRPDRIDSLSLGELQSVDVGSHFSSDFASERIPSLVGLLETLRGRLRFNIEIKEDQMAGDGTATAVGRLVEAMGLTDLALVSSFNPMSLWRVSRVCRVPLGLVFPMSSGVGLRGAFRDRLLHRPWTAPLLGAAALHPCRTEVTANFVAQAHRRGRAVNVWTVNEEAELSRLIALGVDGLITDRPDRALGLLGSAVVQN